jgi:hypothetical protein
MERVWLLFPVVKVVPVTRWRERGASSASFDLWDQIKRG